MPEFNADKLKRAFVRLSELKKSVQAFEKAGDVSEKYVREYHEILQSLEAEGIDIKEFKIPPNMLAPIRTSYNLMTGEAHYSSESFVEYPFFVARLGAILAYFVLSEEERPRTVGFQR